MTSLVRLARQGLLDATDISPTYKTTNDKDYSDRDGREDLRIQRAIIDSLHRLTSPPSYNLSPTKLSQITTLTNILSCPRTSKQPACKHRAL